MGMFDWVDFKMDCPGCGKPVGGFQSKDGDCLLETVKPEAVGHFYTGCDNCDGWIEFHRKEAESVLKDFEMKFRVKP